MTQEGNVLRPAEGKVLTNGSSYSREVWLGINDSPDNWSEVDEAEAKANGFESDQPEEEPLNE